MDKLAKIAYAAFQDELDLLLKLAAFDGIELDPAFSLEKRAAYRKLRESLSDEEVESIDKLALEIAGDFGKLAQWTVIPKILAGAGKALGGLGGLLQRGGTAIARGTGYKVPA